MKVDNVLSHCVSIDKTKKKPFFFNRSTHTDWKKVVKYLIEMTVTIFFTSLLLERYFLTINWKSFISNSEVLFNSNLFKIN